MKIINKKLVSKIIPFPFIFLFVATTFLACEKDEHEDNDLKTISFFPLNKLDSMHTYKLYVNSKLIGNLSDVICPNGGAPDCDTKGMLMVSSREHDWEIVVKIDEDIKDSNNPKDSIVLKGKVGVHSTGSHIGVLSMDKGEFGWLINDGHSLPGGCQNLFWLKF